LQVSFSSAAVLGSFQGPDKSQDGLELTNLKVTASKSTPVVGNTVTVSFKLKNVTGADIKIDAIGVFVGARWNSTTDANNRDFGHTYKGKILKPGKQISISASKKLDAAGTWRFWPAYQISGHWGPFRWHEIAIEVAEAPRPVKLLGSCTDSKGSPDGLKLLNFKIHGPKPSKAGDNITVEFSLKNVSGKPLVFEPHGVFVGARWNSTTDANNRDFGHQHKGKTLSPGSVIKLKAEGKLDAAGTWRFWPAYMVDKHWGPFRWCEVVIEATGTAGNK
jgi:hypothetical protein